MATFKKKKKSTPAIPTAALPDIIFMLLFFFMVTTVMRETDLMVKNNVPKAESIQKLLRKNVVSYIYIGEPTENFTGKYGKEPVIQVNDVIIDKSGIGGFVANEVSKLDPIDRPKIWMSLKIDQDAKMGLVMDVKQELRKANALKINYSSKPKAVVN